MLLPSQIQSFPSRMSPLESRVIFLLELFRGREVLENFSKFLQFFDSIIAGCGGPRRFSHAFQFLCVTNKCPNSGNEVRGFVRIGKNREPSPQPERYHIRFFRRYRNDRLSRREDSVHLAGHNHALESAFHSNDVRVSSRLHGRNFRGREKIQKPDIRCTSCRGFDLHALCAISHEHQTHSIACQVARCRQQRVPRTVEAQIACVQENEWKVAANRAPLRDRAQAAACWWEESLPRRALSQ